MQSIESLVRSITESEGYKVYDLELPHSSSEGGGMLRVYVCHADGSPHKVGFKDCAAVASKLNNSLELDELLPEGVTLEVSSPGVNRQLKDEGHLSFAVGERVRIVVKGNRDGKKKETVRGTLQKVCGEKGVVSVLNEETKELQDISINDIGEARVDFKF